MSGEWETAELEFFAGLCGSFAFSAVKLQIKRHRPASSNSGQRTTPFNSRLPLPHSGKLSKIMRKYLHLKGDSSIFVAVHHRPFRAVSTIPAKNYNPNHRIILTGRESVLFRLHENEEYALFTGRKTERN
jgi:hypothetical protein